MDGQAASIEDDFQSRLSDENLRLHGKIRDLHEAQDRAEALNSRLENENSYLSRRIELYKKDVEDLENKLNNERASKNKIYLEMDSKLTATKMDLIQLTYKNKELQRAYDAAKKVMQTRALTYEGDTTLQMRLEATRAALDQQVSVTQELQDKYDLVVVELETAQQRLDHVRSILEREKREREALMSNLENKKTENQSLIQKYKDAKGVCHEKDKMISILSHQIDKEKENVQLFRKALIDGVNKFRMLGATTHLILPDQEQITRSITMETGEFLDDSDVLELFHSLSIGTCGQLQRVRQKSTIDDRQDSGVQTDYPEEMHFEAFRVDSAEEPSARLALKHCDQSHDKNDLENAHLDHSYHRDNTISQEAICSNQSQVEADLDQAQEETSLKQSFDQARDPSLNLESLPILTNYNSADSTYLKADSTSFHDERGATSEDVLLSKETNCHSPHSSPRPSSLLLTVREDEIDAHGDLNTDAMTLDNEENLPTVIPEARASKELASMDDQADLPLESSADKEPLKEQDHQNSSMLHQPNGPNDLPTQNQDGSTFEMLKRASSSDLRLDGNINHGFQVGEDHGQIQHSIVSDDDVFLQTREVSEIELKSPEEDFGHAQQDHNGHKESLQVQHPALRAHKSLPSYLSEEVDRLSSAHAAHESPREMKRNISLQTGVKRKNGVSRRLVRSSAVDHPIPDIILDSPHAAIAPLRPDLTSSGVVPLKQTRSMELWMDATLNFSATSLTPGDNRNSLKPSRSTSDLSLRSESQMDDRFKRPSYVEKIYQVNQLKSSLGISNRKALPSITREFLQQIGLDESENPDVSKLPSKEVENKFALLSIALKQDRLTLKRRLQEGHKARLHMEKKTEECLEKIKATFTGIIPTIKHTDFIEGLNKVNQHLQFLHNSCNKLVAASESMGATKEEEHMTSAIQVILRHVEELGKQYDKEHKELEELQSIMKHHQGSDRKASIGSNRHQQERRRAISSISSLSSASPTPKSSKESNMTGSFDGGSLEGTFLGNITEDGGQDESQTEDKETDGSSEDQSTDIDTANEEAVNEVKTPLMASSLQFLSRTFSLEEVLDYTQTWDVSLEQLQMGVFALLCLAALVVTLYTFIY